jgi:hypothetical protein
MIYLRFLNKGGGTRSLYRGGGSIGFVAAARAGWLVARDPDHPKRSVLAHVKGNTAGERPVSLRYGFEPTELGVARIKWLGHCPLTADELLEAAVSSSEERSNIDEAMDLMQHLLADGPKLKSVVMEVAKKHGISRATIDRARGRLGLIIRKVPSPDGTFRGNEWALPKERGPERIPA